MKFLFAPLRKDSRLKVLLNESRKHQARICLGNICRSYLISCWKRHYALNILYQCQFLFRLRCKKSDVVNAVTIYRIQPFEISILSLKHVGRLKSNLSKLGKKHFWTSPSQLFRLEVKLTFLKSCWTPHSVRWLDYSFLKPAGLQKGKEENKGFLGGHMRPDTRKGGLSFIFKPVIFQDNSFCSSLALSAHEAKVSLFPVIFYFFGDVYNLREIAHWLWNCAHHLAFFSSYWRESLVNMNYFTKL